MIDFIVRKAVEQPGLGIGRKNDKRLTDLDFADDLALVAEDDQVCQETTTNLAEHSAHFGMHISQEKTKIIRTIPNTRLTADPRRTGRVTMCRPLYLPW